MKVWGVVTHAYAASDRLACVVQSHDAHQNMANLVAPAYPLVDDVFSLRFSTWLLTCSER